MAFSASDAAFEGFRLARRQPLTAVGLSIWQTVVGVFVTWMLISGGFQALMAGAPAGGSTDPQAAMAFFQKIVALEATFIPVIILANIVATGAVYRGVLRPNDGGWVLGLKIGADEVRLFLVSLAKGLLLMAAMLAGGIALVLVVGVVAVALKNSTAGATLSVLIGVLGYIALICLMIFLSVRLSLAGPATVADQRFRLLSTWGDTKGRFWPLLGCYLLAFVLYVLAAVIVYAVCAVGVFVFSGFRFDVVGQQLFSPDMSSVAAYFTPMRIVVTLLSGVAAGVLQMVLLAPVAEAWRQIKGIGAADTFA